MVGSEMRRHLAAASLVAALVGGDVAAQPVDPDTGRRSWASTPALRAETGLLRRALVAARQGRSTEAAGLRAQLESSTARKLVLWATLASNPAADRPAGLSGWPALGGSSGPSAWSLRRRRVSAAIMDRKYELAYRTAADSDLRPGPDLAEAEFYAGWLALRKLGRPEAADRHFARIAAVSSSPISLARAAYWRGRVAERLQQDDAARGFFAAAARYPTTFYGQLAAEKVGRERVDLDSDPLPTALDREALDGRELVQALDLLLATGQTQWVGRFAAASAASLEAPGEYVLLIERLRVAGRQFDSMTVARTAAQHGVVLPERGFPTRALAGSAGLSPAFLHAIVRQESGFDPQARSPAGARGLMQLMPSTAAQVARSEGLAYGAAKLETASYNVRVGSAYLSSLLERFDGSYVLAAAAYNAGPGHMSEWVSACGDPRGGRTDPVDFIECIPFSETRNYVMRVMEGMQVYRAKLSGERAVLSLRQDLSRRAG